MKKRIFLLFAIVFLCFFVITSGCVSNRGDKLLNDYDFYQNESEDYLELDERDFINCEQNDCLNVSLDSSTAGYSNLRRLINNGNQIPKDAVNIEQMLNYFKYSYVNETDEDLAIFSELGKCPWNEDNYLVQMAIKAKNFELNNSKGNNFVFLLDVSGSMYSENKLPLMIEGFNLLIDSLNDNDRISIVTYAGNEQVLLDGGFGSEKTKISAIISDLEANGSTAGSAGIKTAYEIARKYYIEGGNNRVFLATDGDFNVGISSTSQLEKFISQKRETGIYLSVFGFGTGNLKSSTMDTLASKGNGNYYYIDSILEAQKVFVSELGGTLQTVAKDAKAQIKFNKDVVEKYRVIGYENKILSNEEFENSETDAGEIGAGHTTICLVELKLKSDNYNDNMFTCDLRYKTPTDELNKQVINTHSTQIDQATNDFLFASSVAEVGLLLRNSSFKGSASYENVLDRIDKKPFTDDVYKKEFIDLIKKVMEK